jgi:hypothetical protein
MASLEGEYDPDAAPAGNTDPFPEGEYEMELTESDVVPTKAGNGKLLKYTARVVSGDFESRLVWGQINLQNTNPQAQEIGQREFSALRHAVGVLAPNDTQDLHFRAFKAKVVVEPAKTVNGKDYGPRNSIKRFIYEEDGNTSAPPPPATKAAANDNKPAATKITAAPATAAKRPWASKS